MGGFFGNPDAELITRWYQVGPLPHPHLRPPPVKVPAFVLHPAYHRFVTLPHMHWSIEQSMHAYTTTNTQSCKLLVALCPGSVSWGVMQVGAWYPFFRGHAHLETARREPWLFGEETTGRIRNAIRSRYALLPYFYTLFRHANLTGMPVTKTRCLLRPSRCSVARLVSNTFIHVSLRSYPVCCHAWWITLQVGGRALVVTGQPVWRPMWFEFPEQQDLFETEDQFMVGPALLVAPVVQQAASNRSVLLPSSATWYNAITGVYAATCDLLWISS